MHIVQIKHKSINIIAALRVIRPRDFCELNLMTNQSCSLVPLKKVTFIANSIAGSNILSTSMSQFIMSAFH